MKKYLKIRNLAGIVAISSVWLLGACAVPDTPGANAKASADDDLAPPVYQVGSRLPMKDKSQTNAQTTTDASSIR